MSSPRHLSALAVGISLLGSVGKVAAGTPASCLNPQLSCQNTTTVQDLCCFNAPGGQLLLTQFWDTAPVTGPVDSWTVHGLWPDRCDGTYDASCDPSRAYTNITAILNSFGKTDLLSYMSTYWKDYQGDDESFWEHEWGKHGTCISTLEPSCYTNFAPTEEAVAFFQKAVDLFKTLPSYKWLSDAGITPSSTKTYTSAAIQSALSAKHGFQVTLGCKSGALDEIWYHYNVRGSVQTGEFVPTSPDGTKSTCPSTGVKYLPKTSGSGTGTSTLVTSTKTSTSAAPTGTGTTFSGKGYLNVVQSGSSTAKGCLISAGTWYTSGSCASYTASASADGKGFVLSSSKGKCAVTSGAFTCASTVTDGTVFTATGSRLNGDGTNWYADSVPSGTQQATVYSAKHSVTVSLEWQAI